MIIRRGRLLLAVLLALSALGVTALRAGGGAAPARPTAALSTLQYQERGVPGNVAAQALNALAAKQANRGARAMTKVHFILNWLPNVEFAGLWVAAKYGWWKAAGIDMSFTGWSPAVTPETDVPATGGNTFGFQSGAAIAIAASKNVPITALYTDTQKSVFGLTVLANSGITKLTDLKGKKVGYQPHELYVPATMLAYAGLKPTDWKPVPVGFDIVQLTAHRVDAYLVFVTNEPISLGMQGVKSRTFNAGDYGFHAYDDVLFTYNGLITKNPALVKTVTGMVAKGFQWAHTHPVQTARLTTATYFPASKGTSATSNLRQQTLEIEAFAPFARASDGRFSGLMSMATWSDLIHTLFKYHEITSKPNPATIFTNRFNPYK
jgi:ABC-type nitrate/sulfonate/bicarbonate transport system substrate-binding protein